MFPWLFLFDSFRHPVELPARAFDPVLRLLLLFAAHLRQSFPEPPAGTAQDGRRHLQVALEPGSWRGGRRCGLPLRFQKQFRLGEDTLAHQARALAPGGV
jgi:hypothetical protein